ncbi:nitrate- and nitrite sensing domain-containing protein [Streptomyces sp. NPDC048389]|uniref:sensor histidine kinase n=1 Tax=Streptomyces sp. NPDC048389 TaxID=3154622 RepID=UPI0034568CFC
MPTPRTTPGGRTPLPHPPQAGPAVRGRRAHAGPPAVEHTGHEPPPAPAPSRHSRRRLTRPPRTVRAKVISLLMVPVLSLLALWGFATVTTAQDMAGLRQTQHIEEEVMSPTATAVTALQAERRAALRQLADPSDEREAALRLETRRTDDAVGRLRLGDEHTVADGGGMPGGVARRLGRFVARAAAVRDARGAVLDGKADWDQVYGAYTDAVTAGLDVAGAVAGVQDYGPGADARVLLEFARAGEMLAREDVLVTSAQSAGTFDAQRLRTFTGTVATRTALAEGAAADLRGPERAAWRELTARSEYRQLRAAEDRLLTAPPGRKAAKTVPAAWDQAYTAVAEGMRDIANRARRAAADRADPLGGGFLTGAGGAVLLGLFAVVISLVISVRIGRALVVELVALRNSALEIARRKLPHAMRRLRTGEQIDIHAEAPPGIPAEDEVGQVSEALSTVHRAALGAAVERAELAGGISGVFVNLARRSQTLVHRQLTLLDAMERRADDPGELSDLFRLDHLTTRMRRHAESLIILSGAAPGRAWSRPVPLTAVVRAAVSEIEDYARVDVRQLPETAVTGAAVADITHLLAELIENAAQFSPPHTKVRVSGEPVGNGYVLEIEDRGLGMGKDALAEANRRLEESEALDLFDSDRLGLFVVSRLAARHGIKVHLRASPYGGSTAVILLPTALLQSALPAVDETLDARDALDVREVQGRGARDALDARDVRDVRGRGARPHDLPRSEKPHRPAPTPPAPSLPRFPHGDGPAVGSPPASAPPTLRALRRRETAAEAGDGELPRRVRQSHLVPQLREAPRREEPRSAAPADDGPAHRTPELVRDRMTAYRDGWTRGGGSAPGPVAPGTEGDHA